MKNRVYLAAGLAAAAFLAGAFFIGAFLTAFLTAGLVVVCLAAGACFTTGAAKEILPKRRALARIKLNFFMTFIFFSYYY
jgi:hypothetical protein